MANNLPKDWEDQIRSSLQSVQPDWDAEAFWNELEPSIPRRLWQIRLGWLLAILLSAFGAAGLVLAGQFLHRKENLQAFPILFVEDLASHNSLSNGFRQPKPLSTKEKFRKQLSDDQGFDVPVLSKKKQPPNPLEILPTLPKGKIHNQVFSTSTGAQAPLASNTFTPDNRLAPFNNSACDELIDSPTKILSQRQERTWSVSPLPFSYKMISSEPPQLSPVLVQLPKKKATVRWSLASYIGFALPLRTFEASRENSKPLLTLREAYEVPLESLEAGLLFGARFQKWSVQVGLERQQITERFAWGTSKENTVVIPVDSAYFYTDNEGKTQIIAGEVKAQRITQRQVNHYNRYTLFNLPVKLEYREQWNKIGVSLHTGAIINLRQTFEGRFLLPNETLINNGITDNGLIYPTRVGIGWSGGLGVIYTIGQRREISLEGNYRSFTQSFSNPVTSGYEQKYQFIGLQLGWRHHF